MVSRKDRPARRISAPTGMTARALPGAFFLSGFLLFAGCLGGTGTDTENGLEPFTVTIVDPMNRPVSGLEVSVQDASVHGDSIMEDVILNDAGTLTTDSAGSVRLRLARAGLFVVEGRRDDTLFLLDTLRIAVAPGTKTPLFAGLGNPTLMTGVPARAVGWLKLRSGYLPDEGRVYLRGSSLASSLEEGFYDFGVIPSSAKKLTVSATFSAQPTKIRFVKIAVHAGGGASVLEMNGNACLSDPSVATTPADTSDIPLESSEAVARIAGRACAGEESAGTLIRVLRIDAGTESPSSLGEYFIPTADALPADSAALPIACLSPAHTLVGDGILDFESRTIVIDDLRRGNGCPSAE